MEYSLNITNPLKAGQHVTIPAGHPYRHRGSVRVTKRATTVRLHNAWDGYVATMPEPGRPAGFVHLPTISWAGSGGYWSDMPLTPELCEELGFEVPSIPDDPFYRRAGYIEVEPRYGVGFDSRIVVENATA